jgi:hypothetical protein
MAATAAKVSKAMVKGLRFIKVSGRLIDMDKT